MPGTSRDHSRSFPVATSRARPRRPTRSPDTAHSLDTGESLRACAASSASSTARTGTRTTLPPEIAARSSCETASSVTSRNGPGAKAGDRHPGVGMRRLPPVEQVLDLRLLAEVEAFRRSGGKPVVVDRLEPGRRCAIGGQARGDDEAAGAPGPGRPQDLSPPLRGY